MDYALELGRPRETSYVPMRKADIAADLDNPTASSAAPKPRYRIHRVCRREARRSFCDAGPATPSWATRGVRSCARRRERSSQPARGTGPIDRLLPLGLHRHGGSELLEQAGSFGAAVSTFEESLSAWSDGLRRDRGLCLARLSYTHADREDVERACGPAGRQSM
jgi:hypothetical protein